MTDMVPLEAGQLVVKNVMDMAATTGLHVPPLMRGVLGRTAKSMFNDGLELDLITASCYMAVLRGRPELAEHIALDIQLATTGTRMGRQEYEQKLAIRAAEARGGLLADAERQRAVRDTEINQRRNGGSS